MNIDRFVFAFAGTVILVSLILGYLLHPGWLLLAAFVGANMLQSAFTGFCPLARLARRTGMQPGRAFE